ncbi:L-aspartate oxidase [Gordonia neofelifaecis]|uniref:L-aspartate oxidase n=1 Tax=Gordonia neofelifaecis NRRL B-59395 TaxID=644548 RepID=F1YK47_9ACTN|nr:L-aspartate oxidase [Gordonia neofelifaecis]EGD54893.1 L-aspartate oxidase [Gordonia neofelifaecis NRRL B-59395]
MSEQIHVDLVVVGAGVAGLTAALVAASHGLSVTVLTKGWAWAPPGAEHSTSTFYAQGGIAVVDPGDVDDSVALHLSDTLAAGAGLTDPVATEPILAAGWEAVDQLVRWGAEFDIDAAGRFLRTREGGHSVRRIIHAGGDATGARVQEALAAAVAQSSVRVIDHATVTQILTAGGRAAGLEYVRSGVRAALWASSVLLATGGLGHVYSATTNPSGSTGDGIALALRAGAEVADLEFVQFHPTMLYVPGARGRRTLVSEAVRGEGGVLVDADGRSVTAGVHPLGDLAPRDVVARAVTAAMRRTGSPHVWLDISAIDDFEGRFPTVTAGVRASGLDIVGERLPVVPGAHYLCGGVVTDGGARTSVPGLLAAGEVARTGLHGGNRLASNSLLEGLVMGGVAARSAAALAHTAPSYPEVPALTALPACDRTVLQDAMSGAAALDRTAEGLTRLAALLDAAPMRALDTVADIEDANLTLTARAVVAAALAREESRGCHYRADFPWAARQAAPRRFCRADDRLVEVAALGMATVRAGDAGPMVSVGGAP